MCPQSLVKISAICLKTEKIKIWHPRRCRQRETEMWTVAFQDGIELIIPLNSSIKYHRLNEAIPLFHTTSNILKNMVAYWNCPPKACVKVLGIKKKKRFQQGPNFHPIFTIQTTIFLKKCLIYNDIIFIVNVASILCLCMLRIFFKVS